MGLPSKNDNLELLKFKKNCSQNWIGLRYAPLRFSLTLKKTSELK